MQTDIHQLDVLPSEGQLTGKKLYVAGQVSCVSSRVYLQRYEEYLRRFGCTITSKTNEADILLVDTCGFSQIREDQSIDVIEQSKKFAKEGAKVIVCGCVVGINPERVKEKVGADCFSPKNEEQLARILNLDTQKGAIFDTEHIRSRPMGGDWIPEGWRQWMLKAILAPLHATNNRINLRWIPFIRTTLDSTQALNPQAHALTIGQGCYGNCSFCVIPLAKGKTSSLPLGAIVEKVRSLVDSGVRDIILTSEDSGAYGMDNGTSIVDLLRRVQEISGDFRVYVLFFDPRWLRKYREDLLEVLSRGKIQFLQLPLQSGSDDVLKRMRRAYTVDQVLPVIAEIKARFPNVTLATQIIAGFPGETKEEFYQTKTVLNKGLFDRVDVFAYSNRAGTASEKMQGHLPASLIQVRCMQLNFTWFLGRLFRSLKGT